MDAEQIGEHEYCNLAKARNLFPRGTKPSMPTINRWIKSGMRCQGGGRAYLQVVRIGNLRYTTKFMIRRFIKQINGFDETTLP